MLWTGSVHFARFVDTLNPIYSDARTSRDPVKRRSDIRWTLLFTHPDGRHHRIGARTKKELDAELYRRTWRAATDFYERSKAKTGRC